MFSLAPGRSLRYRVVFVDGGSPALALAARRPDEGRSTELELVLSAADGRPLGRGRVALDEGYLGVLRELRRQLAAVGLPWPEAGPELVREGPRDESAQA